MAKVDNYFEGTQAEMLAIAGNFKNCRIYEGDNGLWHCTVKSVKVKTVGKGKLSTKAKVNKAKADEATKLAAREAKKADRKAAKKEAKP